MKLDKEDIRKAQRKGNREAELEINNGFSKSTIIFKNKKKYNRKKKHKNND